MFGSSALSTLALFGAGKIGRSFIAQIFVRNGYKVVFIDVDKELVECINAEGRYRVVTLGNDGSQQEYWVEGVSAVDGRDKEACIELLSRVPLVATSVGAAVIPVVCQTIITAAQHRQSRGGAPFDLILAENMRNAAVVVQQCFDDAALPNGARPGIIEASIGKTAPTVPDAERCTEPLLTYADSYNTLTVSRKNWKGVPPEFPELHLTDAIAAYVDRKLFIHNLAHCSLAYFGYQHLPDAVYIHEVVANTEVKERVWALVNTVAKALIKEYPDEFSDADMEQYLLDVLERIANPALKDSIWRVGQDISRKLRRSERVVGSMLLVMRHGLPIEEHARLYAAALSFRARNENGEYSTTDAQLYKELCWHGLSYAIQEVSQFDTTVADEAHIVKKLLGAICSK